MKNFSLKAKLIVGFLIVGMTPFIVNAVIGYLKTASEIDRFSSELAKNVAHAYSESLKNYFDKEKKSLIDLSESPFLIKAFQELGEPFQKNIPKQESIVGMRSNLFKYYEEKFGAIYFEQTKKKFDMGLVTTKVDDLTVLANWNI